MNLSRKIRTTGTGLIFALSLLGCGSASNDQGVSFSLLGFSNFTLDETTGAPECSLDAFTNSIAIPLGEDGDTGTPVTTTRCLIVQNNMTSVGVRTERVEVSYYIPGAEVQPPSTSAPFTVFVGADAGTDSPDGTQSDSGGDSGTTTTTTKTGITTTGNRTAAPLNMVPAEIRSWLSLNRNLLPEPPFSMDLVMHVAAITTAGDQLMTNDGYFQAQVTNDFNIDGSGSSGTDTTGDTTTGSTTSSDSNIVPVE